LEGCIDRQHTQIGDGSLPGEEPKREKKKEKKRKTKQALARRKEGKENQRRSFKVE